MAGESARNYARRQREKAQRHIRVAERYERGAVGEETTAVELDRLGRQGWVVFHYVRWPGRTRANIDHVVIGPGGVFVVDSKNWNGRVEVKDDVLLQNGRPRESAVVGASEAALAITELLGQVPATGVLCFVSDEALNEWARDVMVCSTSTLATMLTSRPPTMHAAAVQRFAGRLQSSLTAATSHATVGSRRRRPQVAAASQRTPRKQTPQRRSRLLPRLVRLVAVGTAMVVGLTVVLPKLLSEMTSVATSAIQATHSMGTAVSVPGTAARPHLTVTAFRVIDAKPARGAGYTVPDGRQLAAVDVRLANNGDAPWSMASVGTAWSVRDNAGVGYAPSAARRVNVGRTLSPRLVVPPHREVRGLMVFEIPRDRSVSGQVRLNVGPGVPKELRWVV